MEQANRERLDQLEGQQKQIAERLDAVVTDLAAVRAAGARAHNIGVAGLAIAVIALVQVMFRVIVR